MSRMWGISLMVFGVISFAIGSSMYYKSKGDTKGEELEKIVEIAIADGVLTNNEIKLIEKSASEKGLNPDIVISKIKDQIANSESDSETEIIDYNKKNGDDFEKFIVKKFNPKYFSIKEWAGDKYIDGLYSETTSQPDILLELNVNHQKSQFSIECKWRKKFYKDGVLFAKKEQIERYKNFQKERNIPVFIAIGVGGKGISPERLFVVPLTDVSNNYISLEKLKSFEKDINTNFFYEVKHQKLR